MATWWLDELTTAGSEHLQQAYVAGYDAKAQYDPTEDVELLRRYGLDGTSILVDLGAGTGTLALAAVEVGAATIAVDVSPVMVAELQRRAARLPAGKLKVVQGGFLSYRHEGDLADFVFTRNALHQLPDFWKVVALRQIARVLRPGGVLRLRDLVFDIEPDEIETTIDQWMSFAVEDPAIGYTAPEFAEHVRQEFSTFSWLLEPMLQHAGFDIIDREIRGSIYAAYTCRKSDTGGQ